MPCTIYVVGSIAYSQRVYGYYSTLDTFMTDITPSVMRVVLQSITTVQRHVTVCVTLTRDILMLLLTTVCNAIRSLHEIHSMVYTSGKEIPTGKFMIPF